MEYIDDFMDEFALWRLCEELSAIQATLLIVDFDPSYKSYEIESMQSSKKPKGYDAVKTALLYAITSGTLKANIIRKSISSDENYIYLENQRLTKLVETFKIELFLSNSDVEEIEQNLQLNTEIDLDATTIKVDDLRKWLAGRGYKIGFFFPDQTNSPNYLNPTHTNYAPKMAAAIGAWKAVNEEPGLISGKTPKQAMLVWLRKHADKFGLTKDDGSPNEQGIEEIAKIANWDLKGGAPKTPGQ